ncbi:MAG: HlyD family efflux transporter periplasmic adaptor subunit [Rhodospirillaceae bacterium]|nr:HlyD family efflux transporter periplasmic adaptor subunit [Rhodospirillales bacterium]
MTEALNLNPAPAKLPPLRDDLRLYPGPEGRDGTPSWTIHDPARNRYFRIGRAAFEMLARWGVGDPAQVLARTQAETGLSVDQGDLIQMAEFLEMNHLVQRSTAEGVARLGAFAMAARPVWYKWLLHNYLFFRLPLVRPDRFLAAALPLVRPLYTRNFLLAVMAAALLGLFLVARQWDVFLSTFPHFFSWQGAAWFGAALGLSKMVHELGHAFTAKRLGCRVPTMGLAFLVLMPVLYTDTSDVWRLVSRRQRMAVAAAGMGAEMILAAVALLAWSFLPDGPARSAAFAMVTVTLVATIAMNASPFMRFDGYYLLADGLGMENLQERSFALGRWRLREALLGLGEPPPEHFPRRLQFILLAYCYGTWLYRLVLFLGIALLVYHMFFKLLGILLFAVELGWFIAKPVMSEVREWWEYRQQIEAKRLRLPVVLGIAALLLLAVPWKGSVDMPALARASAYSAIFSPQAARLDAIVVKRGDKVEAGAVLAQLSAPDLGNKLIQVQIEVAAQRALLMREAADAKARASVHVLRSQLAAYEREELGLRQAQARLVVRSPMQGTVVDMSPLLRPGLWVNETTPLAYVADRSRPEVIAFLSEEDLRRLQPGARARFIADDPSLASYPCVVTAIADLNVDVLDVPALSSTNNGPIAARKDGDGRLTPAKGIYRVDLSFDGDRPDYEKATRGVVVADGQWRSPLGRIVDVVAAVVVRESGF